MRFVSGILSLCILFFSCTGSPGKENDILPEKNMREVMWDLMRVDQFVNGFLTRDSLDVKQKESIRMYKQVLALHKTTREQFQKSLDYYTATPKAFQPIIDSLAQKQIYL